MYRLTVAVAALTVLAVPTATMADTQPKKKVRSMCARAHTVRTDIVKKHGTRAPGRDICRWGVRTHTGVKHPSVRQRAHYLQALKRLAAPPPPSFVRTAVPPPNPPAGTMTAGVAPASGGLADCIVQRESGGDPQATNGQYHGIAQWDHATWIAHGGGKYASDPLGASKQQQLQVLAGALAAGHSSAWTPYDGC